MNQNTRRLRSNKRKRKSEKVTRSTLTRTQRYKQRKANLAKYNERIVKKEKGHCVVTDARVTGKNSDMFSFWCTETEKVKKFSTLLKSDICKLRLKASDCCLVSNSIVEKLKSGLLTVNVGYKKPCTPTEMSFYHDRFFSLADQQIQEPEQRTPAWFEARKNKLTGSKLASLMFCDSDDDRIRIYEEIFEGRKKEPFPEQAKQYMKWGQDHEDIALGSILNHMPNIVAFEAPMVQHSSCNYLAASPDGLFENTDTGEEGIIEIKCPAKKKKASTTVTYYYVPQMYLEMACAGRRKAMFISWGLDYTRAWQLDWDDDMWQCLCDMIDTFKRTKEGKTWDDFSLAQYKLRQACNKCVENAKPLHQESGWPTASAE